MKAQPVIRISKDQRTLILEKDGSPIFVSVNLIKYLLDLPYTRKDGTVVTENDISIRKSINAAIREKRRHKASVAAPF